jgi:hypothetical protein
MGLRACVWLQNIFGVKNQKRNGKTKPVSGIVMSSQPNTGFVFCISFLVFNYENISILGDSKVGSHL